MRMVIGGAGKGGRGKGGIGRDVQQQWEVGGGMGEGGRLDG